MPFHARAYRGDDLPRVTDLLEARLAAGLACNLSVAEVRQLLPRPATDTERYGRVWEDSSGRLIGFGLIRVPWDTVQLLVHPDQDSERGADGVPGAPEHLGHPPRPGRVDFTVPRSTPW